MQNMELNVDYSQFGEQLIITKFFEKKQGRFLDIGAYDGMLCSNSYALALAGWDGLCVEANPGLFARLMDTYKNNTNVALLNAFVGIESGVTQFYSADLCSTNDLAHLHQFNVANPQIIYVAAIDIALIKDKFSNYYDFISIDVEGGSVELFKQCLQLFEPKLICVEHEHNQDDCVNYASRLGYITVMCNGVNLIMAHK